MTTVKNISLAQRDLSDGRALPPGRTADDVDLDDPHNSALIEAGFLLPIVPADEKTAKQLVAEIKLADADTLDGLEKAEHERDDPRSTVTDAIAARRSTLEQETHS